MYSVFDIANWFLSRQEMTHKNYKNCVIMHKRGHTLFIIVQL